MSGRPNNPMLHAALWYAELGYPVFPCAPGRKTPLTDHGLLEASADTERITAWWTQHPDANIAVRTDGLVVIDIDGEGNAWLTGEPAKLADLEAAPLSLTPRGGRHYFLRQPDGRAWRNTASRLAPHVDTRANGGYVLVAPSVVEGKPYSWQAEHELSMPPQRLSEPPAWLVMLLDALVASNGVATNSTPANAIPEGQRNETLARLAGAMRRVGMSQAEIFAALQQVNADRCSPPLPLREVERTAVSIARYEPDAVSVAVAENHWGQDRGPPAQPVPLTVRELMATHRTLRPPVTDPDEVPEPPDEATTRPGDLWILGDHRLLCGDSASPADVDVLLAVDPAKALELPAGTEVKPTLMPVHLVNTDPPYNVRVEPRSNNAIAAGLSSFQATDAARRHGHMTHHQGFDLARRPEVAKATHKKLRPKDRPLANDFVSDDEFDRLLHAWFGQIARVLLPGRALYCWGGYANCANYPPVLKACGLYFSQAIIWVKEHPVLTRKDFMGNHEWCFYCWREGAAHVYLGPNNATDVWSVKKVNPQSMIHLTEKPVELAVRAIQYSSRTGENVLDLFGGSGSTLIAAEQTGRRAYLMELDPLYCDVIVQRWEKFTGREAERVQTSLPAGEVGLSSAAGKENALDYQAEEEAPVVAEASGEGA